MTLKTDDSGPSIQRRMPAEARRRAIISEAALLLSDAGFEVSTRDIAKRCGITQAALYKHFASKDALIQAVFRSKFLDRDRSTFAEALLGKGGSLESRITAAYRSFFAGIDKINHRLFLRAALEGYPLPSEFSAPLDHEILEPLTAQLRLDGGFPPLDREPLKSRERELMLMLHSTVVFLALRQNVYNIALDGRVDWIIEQDVKVWLTGAREQLKSIWS